MNAVMIPFLGMGTDQLADSIVGVPSRGDNEKLMTGAGTVI